MLRIFFIGALIFVWAKAETREYIVRYQSLSSGSLFHIETKQGEKVAHVKRQTNNCSITYSFVNTADVPLVSGISVVQASNTCVHLSCSNGNKLGWFSAEIRNLYPTEYKIFSKDNQLIAKGFMNWLGSNFAFFDPEKPKRYIVSYFRPMFKLFNDHWHFDIHEEDVIHFGLLSILGVFQTACDLNFEMLEPKASHSAQF